MMPEVYVLRAPENFNSVNNHRSKTIMNQNNRKAEMYHLRSYEPKRTPTYDILKPISLPSQTNSRPATVNIKRKSPIIAQPVHRQKAEMYHLDTRSKRTLEYTPRSPSVVSNHHKPKANGVLTQSSTHPPQTVTTYMLTAPNEDHFLPPITHASSPRVHPNKKRRLATFDATNHNDKYDILNKQRRLSIKNHSLITTTSSSSSSKATDSIHRSMNMYRFKRN